MPLVEIISGEGTSRETVTAQAFLTGQMEIVDHAGRVDTLESELAAVTPEDVQRVARTWLVPEGRTVGWQLATDGEVCHLSPPLEFQVLEGKLLLLKPDPVRNTSDK